MDTRRLFIATLLSLAILLVWREVFPPPAPPAPSAAPKPSAETAARERTSPAARAEAAETGVAETLAGNQAVVEVEASEAQGSALLALPERVASYETNYVLESEQGTAEFSNRGAVLESFRLKNHRSRDGGPVDMVRRRSGVPFPFSVVGADLSEEGINEALFEVEEGSEGLSFHYNGSAGRAQKRFFFDDRGLLHFEISLPGRQDWGVVFGPGLRNPSDKELNNRFASRAGMYLNAGGVERLDPQREEEPVVVSGTGVGWFGLQDNYFLNAIRTEQAAAEIRFYPVILEEDGSLSGPLNRLEEEREPSDNEEDRSREMELLVFPGAETLVGDSYWGAKELDRLAALPGGLDQTVDLGMFAFISRPLLIALKWIYRNMFHNYGWSIVLMTVLIKLLLFPLTHKSQVSMQKMQQLNPKMQAIRGKYRPKLRDKHGRANPEAQRKMNQEIMELYKVEGVNPAGSCLPLLLQMPVFFAFYNLLRTAGELRGAPWLGWIQDLSAADPYYVLPIVMGASWFIQQKITPMAGDPNQRRMMMFMPIIFTFFFLGLPSGLVLYWMTNNLLTLVQQLLYRRFQKPQEATT